LKPYVFKAREFAIARHSMTRYGDGQPYEVHLDAVDQIIIARSDVNLSDLAFLPYERCAAWLHDTIEDTGTTRGEIEQLFGQFVGDIVWACTGIGRNRADQQADIAEKLRRFPAAAPVKLADRIANIEHAKKALISERPGHPAERLHRSIWRRYHEEHELFVAVMRDCGLGDGTYLLARYWQALKIG